MPLSNSKVDRDPIHTRSVECQSYGELTGNGYRRPINRCQTILLRTISEEIEPESHCMTCD